MIEAEELQEAEHAHKPEDEQAKTSLSRTLISLGLFIALDYWMFQSWQAVLILVSVIVIHEAGHFIAMKIFGYKGVNMTFVPFIGAYVSGTAVNLSRKNRLYVILAGPVPGIIIGCIIFYLHQTTYEHIYFQVALPFLALNVFNLLPIFPLDGGQFFQTLFFHGSRIIQLLFLYLSLAALIYLFVKLHNAWPLLLIAALLLIRISMLRFVNKVRKRLDEKNIDYACSYDDLTDDQYWEIRNVIVAESRVLSRKFEQDMTSENEQQLVKHVENVLTPAYDDDLEPMHKAIFSLVWLLAFTTPVVQWLFYKGLL